MKETSIPTIKEADLLMPLAGEHPKPELTEPPPDLFPIPKLPDERAKDTLPERKDVNA